MTDPRGGYRLMDAPFRPGGEPGEEDALDACLRRHGPWAVKAELQEG